MYYAYFRLLKECMSTSLELNTTKSKVAVIGTVQILTYWWTHYKQLNAIKNLLNTDTKGMSQVYNVCIPKVYFIVDIEI